MDQNNMNNELNNQNNEGLGTLNNVQQPVTEQVTPVEPVASSTPVAPVEPVVESAPVEQPTVTPTVTNDQPINNVQPVQTTEFNPQPIQNVVNNTTSFQEAPKTKSASSIILIVFLILVGVGIGVYIYLQIATTKVALEVRDDQAIKNFVYEVTKVYTAAQNQYMTEKATGTDTNRKKLDVVGTSGNSYSCYAYGVDDIGLSTTTTSAGYYGTVLMCQNKVDNSVNIIITYANSKYYLDGYFNYSKNSNLNDNVKKGEKSKNVVYITSNTSESDYEKIKNSVASLLD